MFSMNFSSLKKLEQKITQKKSEMKTLHRRLLYDFGRDTQKEIKEEMTKKNKTGRVYKVYSGVGGNRLVNARLHRASAKLEHPAVRSGNLRNSMYFKVRGSDSVVIGASAKYAKYLEFGTSRMAARKFLERTADKKIHQFATKTQNEFGKLFRSI